MHPLELDQTYLLQSYNEKCIENQGIKTIGELQNIQLRNSEMQEIKVSDKMLEDQLYGLSCDYSQSQELKSYECELNSIHEQKQERSKSSNKQNIIRSNLANKYKLELQNYSSIELISPSFIQNKASTTHPPVKVFCIGEIHDEVTAEKLPPPKNLAPIYQIVSELVEKYQKVSKQSEQKSQIIEEMQQIIEMQKECISNHQAELRYLQKKIGEYDKTINKLIRTNKLQQCLSDSKYKNSAFRNLQEGVSEAIEETVKRVKQLMKKETINRNENKNRSQSKSKRDRDRQVSYESVNGKTIEFETDKFINVSHEFQDQNRNAFILNRAVPQTHQRLIQKNSNIHDFSNKTQKRKISERTCTDFIEPADCWPNRSKGFRQYEEISEARYKSVYDDEDAQSKIENYRQLTNFRIKQLERDNESHLNELNSLRGKCLILRNQNNEFKDIIESLIKEIKLQTLQ